MSIEERNDRLEEITPSSDHELDKMLTMVVVSAVGEQPAYPEELSELLEAVQALHTLRHDKPRRHLDSGHVAGSVRSAWLPNEAD